MSDFEAYSSCITNYAALARSRQPLYSELLSAADPALRALRQGDCLRPPRFNIFFALGHAYRETSTHSALLAHLLDPAGDHAQGALFLRSFLDLVQGAAKSQGKTLLLPVPEDPTRWRCRKELPIPKGQIDIVLRGPGLLLVIENKIFTVDSKGQLQKYWCFAKREAQEKRLLPVIVYLTPDGDPPTQSIKDPPASKIN